MEIEKIEEIEEIASGKKGEARKGEVRKGEVKAKAEAFIEDLIQMNPAEYSDRVKYHSAMIRLARKYKYFPSKHTLSVTYLELHRLNPIVYPMIPELKRVLMVNAVRSHSGILNVSISLPPHQFSCQYNCFFCPNEAGMPRSYLRNEDVFKRALDVNFDTVKQVHARFNVLRDNGHPIDKVEYRVLGGTFSCYDHTVTDQFIRDLYYAANIYQISNPREPLTIEEEQMINIHSVVHIVGLGVETRPDRITEEEIIRFRQYGITRVEIGVQHTDDRLLKIVNRGHTVQQSKDAIRLLKDYGFKIEIHIMTDLPEATPEGDRECYRQVLSDDHSLLPDYLKDYPCLDVSYTVIKKWKAMGRWKPYSERTPDARDLIDVLVYRQSITPDCVRTSRTMRDIPPESTSKDHLGYTSDSIKTSLGDIIKIEAEKRGIYCQCIRCCEIKDEKFDPSEIQYHVEEVPTPSVMEYFISAKIPREHRPILLGFLRLRINSETFQSVLPELKGSLALIRELHVYGRLKEVGDNSTGVGAQHLGIGSQLLQIAESLAQDHHKTKIAVISGIGVRGYYQKFGYCLEVQVKQTLMTTYCVIFEDQDEHDVGVKGVFTSYETAKQKLFSMYLNHFPPKIRSKYPIEIMEKAKKRFKNSQPRFKNHYLGGLRFGCGYYSIVIVEPEELIEPEDDSENETPDDYDPD